MQCKIKINIAIIFLFGSSTSGLFNTIRHCRIWETHLTVNSNLQNWSYEIKETQLFFTRYIAKQKWKRKKGFETFEEKNIVQNCSVWHPSCRILASAKSNKREKCGWDFQVPNIIMNFALLLLSVIHTTYLGAMYGRSYLGY